MEKGGTYAKGRDLWEKVETEIMLNCQSYQQCERLTIGI
jgi:hypothetical protein